METEMNQEVWAASSDLVVWSARQQPASQHHSAQSSLFHLISNTKLPHCPLFFLSPHLGHMACIKSNYPNWKIACDPFCPFSNYAQNREKTIRCPFFYYYYFGSWNKKTLFRFSTFGFILKNEWHTDSPCLGPSQKRIVTPAAQKLAN